ncbi:unnamed protein product, partial [Symbiodinium sp. KB8]
ASSQEADFAPSELPQSDAEEQWEPDPVHGGSGSFETGFLLPAHMTAAHLAWLLGEAVDFDDGEGRYGHEWTADDIVDDYGDAPPPEAEEVSPA